MYEIYHRIYSCAAE